MNSAFDVVNQPCFAQARSAQRDQAACGVLRRGRLEISAAAQSEVIRLPAAGYVRGNCRGLVGGEIIAASLMRCDEGF